MLFWGLYCAWKYRKVNVTHKHRWVIRSIGVWWYVLVDVWIHVLFPWFLRADWACTNKSCQLIWIRRSWQWCRGWPALSSVTSHEEWTWGATTPWTNSLVSSTLHRTRWSFSRWPTTTIIIVSHARLEFVYGVQTKVRGFIFGAKRIIVCK